MRPVFKRSLALALCGALATSSLAFAATPERPVLLQRIRKAMPSVFEGQVVVVTYTAFMTDMLTRPNPGQDAKVKPIADAFGACVGEALKDIDFNDAAVAAMGRSELTDEELLKIAAFYEAPEAVEFFKILTLAMTEGGPPKDFKEPSPEMLKRLEVMTTDPAFVRLGPVVKGATQGAMAAEQARLTPCMAEAGSAAESAGLKLE